MHASAGSPSGWLASWLARCTFLFQRDRVKPVSRILPALGTRPPLLGTDVHQMGSPHHRSIIASSTSINRNSVSGRSKPWLDVPTLPHRLDGVAALLVTTTVECPGQVPPNHQCPLKPPHGDLNCAFPAELAGRVVQVTGRVRS